MNDLKSITDGYSSEFIKEFIQTVKEFMTYNDDPMLEEFDDRELSMYRESLSWNVPLPE